MPAVTTRRKKPVEVRTLEWDGSNLEELRTFCGGAFEPPTPGYGAQLWNAEEECWINLPVGHHAVRGPLGEFYPLSPAALELTYEPPALDADERLRRSEEDGARARQEAADALTRLDEEIGCADWPTLSRACFGSRCSECGGCFECPCHGKDQGDASCSGPAAQTVPNNQEQQ